MKIASPSRITYKLRTLIIYAHPKQQMFFVSHFKGFRSWRLYLLWCTFIYSLLAIFAQVTFHLIWCIEGMGWSVAHSWWAQLVGLGR
jgi:hypothetical protein